MASSGHRVDALSARVVGFSRCRLGPHCRAPARYVVAWEQDSPNPRAGRARVTRHACQGHAEDFAGRHGLQLPPRPA